MTLTYLLLPIFLWSFTLFFIWRYPLDRGRMSGIRAILEARRGKL
jgi:GPH family glycoside/pentoside/hexuronide:cation symporter